MQVARSKGIRVQAAVSPTLPHNTGRFAALLSESADRVIVDTFSGDGANGKRTAHRPLPRRFAELGYGNWRDQSAAEALYLRLVERLGPENVGWSQEGFNALAASSPQAAGPVVEPTQSLPVVRFRGRPLPLRGPSASLPMGR